MIYCHVAIQKYFISHFPQTAQPFVSNKQCFEQTRRGVQLLGGRSDTSARSSDLPLSKYALNILCLVLKRRTCNWAKAEESQYPVMCEKRTFACGCLLSCIYTNMDTTTHISKLLAYDALRSSQLFCSHVSMFPGWMVLVQPRQHTDMTAKQLPGTYSIICKQLTYMRCSFIYMNINNHAVPLTSKSSLFTHDRVLTFFCLYSVTCSCLIYFC